MRVLLTTFLILFLFENSNGQTSVFKTTYFYESIIKTKFDTLAVNEKIDIGFYRKHFHIPYYLPQQLVNEQYKDTTILKWADENFNGNCPYTYVYDSLSRVINHNFSGVRCQWFFWTSIFYDELNRPIKIQKEYLPFNFESEEYYGELIIEYDDKGDIVQLKEYSFGRLKMQIEKTASDN